jgi:probable rRNA maturation factor
VSKDFQLRNSRSAQIVVDVERHAAGWKRSVRIAVKLRRAALATLQHAGVTLADPVMLCVSLADDAAVRAANRHWRAKDKPTNVLSFPAVSPDKLSKAPFVGDVILALETVEAEAAEQNKTLVDHATHLVVHGVLHLLGFDHITVTDAEQMEQLERRVLATLGISDPYAATEPEETRAR